MILVIFNGPMRLREGRDHEEEAVHGGADRVCSSSIGSGYASSGADPRDGEFGTERSEANLRMYSGLDHSKKHDAGLGMLEWRQLNRLEVENKKVRAEVHGNL